MSHFYTLYVLHDINICEKCLCPFGKAIKPFDGISLVMFSYPFMRAIFIFTFRNCLIQVITGIFVRHCCQERTSF